MASASERPQQVFFRFLHQLENCEIKAESEICPRVPVLTTQGRKPKLLFREAKQNGTRPCVGFLLMVVAFIELFNQGKKSSCVCRLLLVLLAPRDSSALIQRMGRGARAVPPGSRGGGTTPGRVYKGQKMSGHMGAERTTVKSLRVVKIDTERRLKIDT